MSPRTQEQNLEIRKQREELILTATLKMFSTNGYVGTSMQSISKEAGISKGNLYNYFESKEELLKAVLINGINQFAELMGSYPSELISENDFERMIKGNFEIVKSNSNYWKLYFNILTQPQANALFQEIFAPLLDGYLKVFESYFRNRGDKNPQITSMLLGSTLDGISIGYIMMGDLYPIDEVINELIEKFK